MVCGHWVLRETAVPSIVKRRVESAYYAGQLCFVQCLSGFLFLTKDGIIQPACGGFVLARLMQSKVNKDLSLI
jgi:hypothetical protein